MDFATRTIRTIPGSVLLFALLANCLAGCVYRSAGTAHYIGPVLFRYAQPPHRQAYIGQVVRLGVSAEAGESWGIVVGVSERTVVAPLEVQSQSAGIETVKTGWVAPLGGADAAAPEEWHLSLFYLRVEPPPDNFFVARKTYGVEAVLGTEDRGLTLGFARKTLFTPAGNAVSMLHYESAQPLQSRAKIWRAMPSGGAIPSISWEEFRQ